MIEVRIWILVVMVIASILAAVSSSFYEHKINKLKKRIFELETELKYKDKNN